eukprot:12583227-Alexandrium_andersonii.AAC.1
MPVHARLGSALPARPRGCAWPVSSQLILGSPPAVPPMSLAAAHVCVRLGPAVLARPRGPPGPSCSAPLGPCRRT